MEENKILIKNEISNEEMNKMWSQNGTTSIAKSFLKIFNTL